MRNVGKVYRLEELIYSEDGRSMFLRNLGEYLPDYTADDDKLEISVSLLSAFTKTTELGTRMNRASTC
jgi:hypothetical protein